MKRTCRIATHPCNTNMLPVTIKRYFSFFVCVVLVIFLQMGCGLLRKDNMPSPPEASGIVVDPNAKALQQALTLQKLTQEKQGAYSYRIGPNDVLEIKVFEQPDMNMSTRVGGKGMINFPPIGEIKVAGLDERTLEALIEGKLRGTFIQKPHVSVFVKEIQARRVGIVGAVNKPGQYSAFGEMNLAGLIAQAGGLGAGAGSVAYIVRYVSPAEGAKTPTTAPSQNTSESQTIKIDLDGLLLRGEKTWDVALLGGDLVNIPVAGFVYVTGGGIKKPGTYELKGGMTLQQAVDLAEGRKFEASGNIYLVRQNEAGERKIYKVNYRELRNKRTEDIQLQARDKIIVDRATGKYVLALIGRGFEKIFRFTINADYDLFGQQTSASGNSGSSSAE